MCHYHENTGQGCVMDISCATYDKFADISMSGPKRMLCVVHFRVIICDLDHKKHVKLSTFCDYSDCALSSILFCI